MCANQLNSNQITTMIVTMTIGITNSCKMKPTVGGSTGGSSPDGDLRGLSGGGDSGCEIVVML
jgi:hypothetical protein